MLGTGPAGERMTPRKGAEGAEDLRKGFKELTTAFTALAGRFALRFSQLGGHLWLPTATSPP